MKRLFVILVLMFTSLFAHAQKVGADRVADAGWNNLSPQEQQLVLKQIQAMRGEVGSGERNLVESVDKWVGLGERLGQMVGGAAKEVGIAVNDFVKTPVGMMTTAVIVWKYIGRDLTKIASAFVTLFVGMLVIFFVFRNSRSRTITYDETKTDLFGRARLKQVHVQSLSTDAMWGMILSSGALFIVCLIVAL